jgi:uncharacterized protein (TIGR02285 family)
MHTYIISMRLVLIGVAFLLNFVPSHVFAGGTLVWFKFDFPPLYIVKGPQTGQGILDIVLQRIIREMPEYSHEIRIVNLSRVVTELQRGENRCTAALFRTDSRKLIGYFSSHPTTFLPSVQLVVRRGEEDQFIKAPDTVPHLVDLLQHGGPLLGVASGMSYGKKVDTAIIQATDAGTVFSRGGNDIGKGLLEMTLKKRIDYTISYPWSVTYTVGPQTAQGLSFIPFAESGKNLKHYAFCTKNDWGASVIDKVDAILEKALPTKRYRSVIEKWLPKPNRADFLRSYNTYFGIDESG